LHGVTYFMCDMIFRDPQSHEEREDLFQDITLSHHDEANDEVNVIDNDGDRGYIIETNSESL